MNELISKLDQWHAMEVFFIVSIALILIDYFFTVDYPAYVAYLFCAAGVFLAVPWEIPMRALLGVGIWVVLLVLHKVWFTHFLTNSHDARGTAR